MGKEYVMDRRDSRINPQCFKCKHVRLVVADHTCDAFPEGIPRKIWWGEFDHTLPFPGDHGIQFELGEPFLSNPDAGKREEKVEVRIEPGWDDEPDYAGEEQREYERILESISHNSDDLAFMISEYKRGIKEIQALRFRTAIEQKEADETIESLREDIKGFERELTAKLFTE